MQESIFISPKVATLQNVALGAVYAVGREGLIPAYNVPGQWRFKHGDIDRWIDEQTASVKGNLGKGAADV